jgi:hypothetical protein
MNYQLGLIRWPTFSNLIGAGSDGMNDALVQRDQS